MSKYRGVVCTKFKESRNSVLNALLPVLVHLHVGSQVGSVRELLTTVGTAVGFLSCVRSHVSLQQPGTTEGFPAQLALVVVGVGEEVHV